MNLDQYISTQLKDGERLIRVIRPHLAMVLSAVVGGGLLMIVDFFLIAWWFRYHQWGAWGFTIVLLLAAWLIARSLYIWRRNVLIVTSTRIIDMKQTGLFERHVAEAPFDKIQDIRYAIKGLWSTLFQFGTITLQTAGQDSMDLRFVVHPMAVQQELAQLQQRQQAKSPGPLSAADLVQMVDQFKNQLSPEQRPPFSRRQRHD